MTRRRLRSIILWTGTTLCVLITAAFVLSGWWQVQVPLPDGAFVYIRSGTVEAILFDDNIWHIRWGWLESHEFDLSWGSFRLGSHSYTAQVAFPIWLPGLIVAIPTFLVWRFGPKFPRGHCRRCGYNLKGLTEPRCPECGAGFSEASA